ncbi:MAG: amidase family protein [Geminicoccaceae bacterium]
MRRGPADPRSLPRRAQLSPACEQPAQAPPRRLQRRSRHHPVDPEVAAICAAAAAKLASAGVDVEEAHPTCRTPTMPFSLAGRSLRRLAWRPAARVSASAEAGDGLNIEKGLKLGAAEHLEAEAQRAEMVERTVAFFETFDLLLAPATIVAPFPVEHRYVESCAGHKFETYIDWLAIAYAITLTTAPALSMPCGFTASGLPVGLQVVARPRAEHDLLAHAAFIEGVLDAAITTPIDPR